MPPATARLLEAISLGFLRERDLLADGLAAEIQSAIPEFGAFEGPELRAMVRASCLANLDEGLGRLAADRSLPDTIPPDARELALVCARLELPLAALLRAYRVAHARMLDAWFAAVDSEEADPATKRAALASASRFLFDYIDRVCGFVTDEYTAERDRFVRSRDRRRSELVQAVLDGAEPEPGEALRTLGYELRLEHLACVVSAPDVDAVVRELARALDAPHTLVVGLAGDTAWCWLGRTRRYEPFERLEAPAGARVSLGDPGHGVEGFRRSHREARDAHAVPRAAGDAGTVVRYDDVALEALVAGDPERALRFARRELRGLDGADTRSRRLRETLRAYFAAAQNASAAAALLGVHEHTVAYRLRTVEARLGRPVNARRAELETALRVLDAGGR